MLGIRWTQVGAKVSTTTDFPTANQVRPSPTSTLHINSSAREASWTPPPKAQQLPPGTQRNNQLCLLCPAYQDSGGSTLFLNKATHRKQRCSQPVLHKSCKYHCCSLLPAEHSTAKHVLWGPWEKTLYQPPGQCVQNVLLLQSLPSSLPRVGKFSAPQLELQVKQGLFSNVTCSKGWA